MFSTLLPRPKNSEYDPSYHFIPTRGTQVVQTPPPPKETASKYDATIPLKKRYPDLVHDFPKPDPDPALLESTRAVFDALLDPAEESTSEPSYVSYANQDAEKVIQVRTMQADPMLPPSHKLRKNRHDRVVDAGLTIVKDTNAARVSREDREYWNVPAAVSNWKNSQGFTIGLDKRMIGREREGAEMNLKKFGELLEALGEADRRAREDIRKRNEARMREQEAEKRSREEKIREIASRAKRRKY
ncbi:Pre-mRNA-processing protein 45 [Candida viswanathii]|uniref:Pre-mRNA-processing protein 45 n=1 Tax=Candida viswanathii TaxID=5486 RepID=A0A367XVV4_9ASCO|nr:Pre-mRNA-processing protein 45 [Candida viswanathii]